VRRKSTYAAGDGCFPIALFDSSANVADEKSCQFKTLHSHLLSPAVVRVRLLRSLASPPLSVLSAAVADLCQTWLLLLLLRMDRKKEFESEKRRTREKSAFKFDKGGKRRLHRVIRSENRKESVSIFPLALCCFSHSRPTRFFGTVWSGVCAGTAKTGGKSANGLFVFSDPIEKRSTQKFERWIPPTRFQVLFCAAFLAASRAARVCFAARCPGFRAVFLQLASSRLSSFLSPRCLPSIWLLLLLTVTHA
jgi:hypothetical protein